MKTSTTTTVMLKAIDLELKAMLTQDIANFKSNSPAKQMAPKKAA